jgi:23S rRNA-/tRNA-specific pseudouridylate synthase
MWPELLSHEGSLVVVSKPSGWLVHAADEADEAPDLQAWLSERLDVLVAPAPAHRIDRETSGVVLYATTSEEAARLGQWFAGGEVKKRYVALVYGDPGESGVLDAPLDDQRRGKPLEARTSYVRRAVFLGGAASLVEVELETGRKHQIRRHFYEAGHGLVGDRRYRTGGKLAPGVDAGRLWLHAWQLTLPDGRSYEAALPEELGASLEVLRGRGS